MGVITQIKPMVTIFNNIEQPRVVVTHMVGVELWADIPATLGAMIMPEDLRRIILPIIIVILRIILPENVYCLLFVISSRAGKTPKCFQVLLSNAQTINVNLRKRIL